MSSCNNLTVLCQNFNNTSEKNFTLDYNTAIIGSFRYLSALVDNLDYFVFVCTFYWLKKKGENIIPKHIDFLT